MDVVLAGTDSLWLLRKVRSEKDLGLVATDEAPLAPTVRASNLPAIVGALPQDFRVIGPQTPLELASFSREARPCIGSVRARTIPGNLPPGAFLRVNGLSGKDLRIFVEGTALTLTHMAARLAQPIKEKTLTEQAAFFRLMSLASELCSTYGRDPTNPARGDCAWGVDPLCTPLELKQSLVEVSGARGVRQARRAAGLVTPGSASPAESLLAMAMSLPASLGGVPFPAFQHNKALSWPQDVNGLTKHRTMTPDFYWPQHSVALEYNGARHAEEDRVWEDHRRQQDYTACGISLLCAQAEDLKSAGALERLMRIVALQLATQEKAGFLQEVEAALLKPGSSAARATLISQLLPPNCSKTEGEPSTREEQAIQCELLPALAPHWMRREEQNAGTSRQRRIQCGP